MQLSIDSNIQLSSPIRNLKEHNRVGVIIMKWKKKLCRALVYFMFNNSFNISGLYMNFVSVLILSANAINFNTLFQQIFRWQTKVLLERGRVCFYLCACVYGGLVQGKMFIIYLYENSYQCQFIFFLRSFQITCTTFAVVIVGWLLRPI